LKILYQANAPWLPTGYGIQSNYLVPGWQRLGHQVTIFAFDSLFLGSLNLGNVQILPTRGFGDRFGNEIIDEYVRLLKPDVVITLMDVWVLKDYGKRGFRWVPWLPVDHDPVPKIVAEALEGAYLPIAYSRFGQRKLREVGIEAEYIPHGVDTKVYRPLPREEARASLGGEGRVACQAKVQIPHQPNQLSSHPGHRFHRGMPGGRLSSLRQRGGEGEAAPEGKAFCSRVRLGASHRDEVAPPVREHGENIEKEVT